MDSRSSPDVAVNSTCDKIIDFDNLRENVTGKLSLENWMVLPSHRSLHIFSLNKMLNGNLSIRNTIFIDVDLVVKVFGEDNDETLFSLKLYSWPQLQTLIEQCGAQVKPEVELEFADVVGKTASSETNNCEKDTLAVEFCSIVTKPELSEVAITDFHQPLAELIQNSISEMEALGYSNPFISQSSFIHEAPPIYPEGEFRGYSLDQRDVLSVYKRSEIDTHHLQTCSICNESYVVGETDRHMRKHFNGEYYQCHVCGQEYQNSIRLQKHVKSKHITSRDEFFCDICKNANVFQTKAGIEEHMKNRHCRPSISDMKCSICGKEFFTRSKFTAHVRGHDRRGWKKCPICNESFGSLTRHMNGKHLKIRNYICDICGSAYTQWTSLKEHIETKHMQIHKRKSENAATWPCEKCGKVFAFRRLLNVHVQLHSGKSYVCNECGQSFRHNKYLAKHRKQHRAIVKLRCTMCEKEYVQKVGLRLHMKKIHGVVLDTNQKQL
ncbi:zinc finger protein 2-like isoform X2 [Bradysia coprophila]|uniref:zinc finger protein 2-like isoform X2 n=1 Tax=Bradysia coprophila TaxID=38358 RepID=UPI00187DC8AC|nr:zinc finger protein 2-like isoform X2 [Bradysia coprophila]